MATTTTKDNWDARPWFGSIATLAVAAEAAEAELLDIDGPDPTEANGTEPKTETTVEYEGGTLKAADLAELREELPQLELRDDISSLAFSLSTANYHCSITATAWSGVQVRISGTRAAVVHGLVTTLQRKLEPGTAKARTQPLEPIEREAWALAAMCWAGGIGIGAIVVWGIAEVGFDFFLVGFGFVPIGLVVLGTSMLFYRHRPSRPVWSWCRQPVRTTRRRHWMSAGRSSAFAIGSGATRSSRLAGRWYSRLQRTSSPTRFRSPAARPSSAMAD